jgi:hypothetical protein
MFSFSTVGLWDVCMLGECCSGIQGVLWWTYTIAIQRISFDLRPITLGGKILFYGATVQCLLLLSFSPLHTFSLLPRAVVGWCHRIQLASKPCALEDVVGGKNTALCFHKVRVLCWNSTHGRPRELVTSLLMSVNANAVVSELARKFKFWGYSRSMWNWSPCHWSNVTVSIKCPSVELWPYGASHQLPKCSTPKHTVCSSCLIIHEEQMMHMTDWDIVTWSHS